MLAADVVAAANAIARQLSGLFDELAAGRLYSDVIAVSLAGAPAVGRTVKLYLIQCDSDDLALVSIVRKWWEMDAAGLREVVYGPTTRELIQSERFGVEFPYIRFATDGCRVRFGARFGPSWLVTREGAMVAGMFNPNSLVDPYPLVN